MVKLPRAQIRLGVKGVDVTAKSAKGFARLFAPTWKMVMGYKNGTLTEAEYTEQYMKILGAVSVEAWRWLYSQVVNGEVVLLRYCRDPPTTTVSADGAAARLATAPKGTDHYTSHLPAVSHLTST